MRKCEVCDAKTPHKNHYGEWYCMTHLMQNSGIRRDVYGKRVR